MVTSVVVVVAACHEGVDLTLEATGQMTVAIAEAPADVRCLRIRVVGTRTVERDFDVAPGQSTELALQGLPLGDVLVEGEAFGVRCALVTEESVPGWVGGPTEAVIESADPALVVLPMRRNGRADVVADFLEEEPCLALGSSCTANTQCCSLSCLPDESAPETSTCQPAPTCSEGLTGCGDSCVDLSSDESHCGGCGFACATGEDCVDGVCVASCVAPSAETCNGVDDDCDGTVDEGNPGGGGACDTGLLGVCAEGTESCIEGSLECLQNQNASAESCNGLDDDCDGSIDEGNPEGGGACDTGLLGVCAAGTETCTGGELSCVQDETASPETCNGVDDDCDGVVDDGCV